MAIDGILHLNSIQSIDPLHVTSGYFTHRRFKLFNRIWCLRLQDIFHLCLKVESTSSLLVVRGNTKEIRYCYPQADSTR